MPRKKKDPELEARKKEEVDRFNKWVPLAAKIHVKTFCMKKGDVRVTGELTGEECVSCMQFVVNGGLCDPL
jgi:hypothetical protein